MATDLPWGKKLRPEVIQRWDEMIQLRREFHEYPELSWQEHKTSGRIKEWLQAEDIENVTTVADTGVVALIRGEHPGPTIMYRADIDGLPIQENSGVEFGSKNAGAMHSCGHDGHIAVALMLASLLHHRRQDLKGNVKVIFQPAEELIGGAEPMIQQGVMEDPHVDAVLALHVAGLMPIGMIGITPGPAMAGVGNFQITILGKGGHAAFPHLAVDPIVAGAQVVNALQTVVSRNVDPTQLAVVTVGTFHGGTKENIIPDSVEITGTFRAFDMTLLNQLAQRIESIVKGATETMGASFEFHHQITCPAVVNDDAFSQRVHRHAEDLVGDKSIIQVTIPASDDMASFLQKAPGCYFLLGGADAPLGPQNHHQPRFAFNDRSLALGLELSLRVIEEYLTS